MVSQIRVCGADRSPSTSQLGAAPGKSESAAVPSGIALQQVKAAASQTSTRTLNLDVPRRLTSDQKEEVAGYIGTFEDAVYDRIIPEPRMMPFTEWARWRRAEGLLSIPKYGADRLLAYFEELKIWDRVMNYYHGDEWRWIMDTWEISETENVEAYLEAIKEDEGVLEQPAPRDTAEFEGNSVVAAEPVGSAPVEDLYELYAERMHKLYAALDMTHNRVDETTCRIKFWNSEIAAQIS